MDGFTACQRVLPGRCSIIGSGCFGREDTHGTLDPAEEQASNGKNDESPAEFLCLSFCCTTSVP